MDASTAPLQTPLPVGQRSRARGRGGIPHDGPPGEATGELTWRGAAPSLAKGDPQDASGVFARGWRSLRPLALVLGRRRLPRGTQSAKRPPRVKTGGRCCLAPNTIGARKSGRLMMAVPRCASNRRLLEAADRFQMVSDQLRRLLGAEGGGCLEEKEGRQAEPGS